MLRSPPILRLSSDQRVPGWDRKLDRVALRILIVDDNRDAADSLATLVGLWGHVPRVAYDGHAGLAAACEEHPDCLILDINMPRMDGYTLARLVRQRGPAGAKLVALSANADPAHGRRAEEAGFDYRLTKPADLNELERMLKMVEHVVRLAEQTEELAGKNVAIAERTERLADRNTTLAGETKQLLEEVKDELKGIKEDVKEIKDELKEVKDEVRDVKERVDQAGEEGEGWKGREPGTVSAA